MRYDVIVIGAGSAGCVMASRLSEDPSTSVLLLEAGPDYPTFAHLPDDLKLGNHVWLSASGPHNWGYVAQLTPQHTRLTIPRGKATGGSSAVNGQVLYRGIRRVDRERGHCCLFSRSPPEPDVRLSPHPALQFPLFPSPGSTPWPGIMFRIVSALRISRTFASFPLGNLLSFADGLL